MDFLGIGPLELILILIVFFIFVGPDKLPEVAGAIGRGIRKLKAATTELSKDFKEMADEVKDSGKEIESIVNSKTGLTSDLKEVVKEIGEAKRGINTALNPRAGLASELKEIAKDITEVGREVGKAAEETSAAPKPAPEGKVDAQPEETRQNNADS
jgi:sec-independent protein translocase protein TatB